MNKKIIIGLVAVFLFLLGGSGYLVYRAFAPAPVSKETEASNEQTMEVIPTIDPSIKVSVVRSKKEANTVSLSVTGLPDTMSQLEYELSYDSEGLIKGVNSGSKPIDLSGKETFEREVYLGTCSRNVCKPDVGVKSVSVSLELTDNSDKKSQFSQDYEL